MTLTPETYELIISLLEAEYNSNDDKDYRKELAQALEELDTLGVY